MTNPEVASRRAEPPPSARPVARRSTLFLLAGLVSFLRPGSALARDPHGAPASPPVRVLRLLDHDTGYLDVLLRAALEATPGERIGVETTREPDVILEKALPFGRGPWAVTERNLADIHIGDVDARLLPAMEPVKFPLYKGLFGVLVFRHRVGDGRRFARIRTKADLAAFSIGLGRDWGEYAKLKENGLSVVGAGTHVNLDDMLERGRFDLYMRTATTIFRRYGRPGASFGILESVVATLPNDHIAWMRKKDAPIARRLEAGLRALARRGELDALLQRRFGADLRRLRTFRADVIRLENPFPIPGFPFGEAGLWEELPVHKRGTEASESAKGASL